MIAQFNIARMRFPWDDPRWESFKALQEAAHWNAEKHPGFVDRGVCGENTEDGYIVVAGDPLLMGNVSTWKDVGSLKDYVFHDPIHRHLMQWRHEWFEKMTEPHLVIFPTEFSVRDLAVCEAKLRFLKENGPSELAFGW